MPQKFCCCCNSFEQAAKAHKIIYSETYGTWMACFDSKEYDDILFCPFCGDRLGLASPKQRRVK